MSLASASSFSDYTEAKILGWLSGVNMPAAAATLYVGLFITNPADDGTGASPHDGTEMSTTNGTTGFSNYARQAETATTVWNAIAAATGDSTGQQLSNAASIAPATAWTNNGGSTVTVAGIGIWDAATAGNLLTYYPLTTPQAVTNGVAYSLAASGLVTQVD